MTEYPSAPKDTPGGEPNSLAAGRVDGTPQPDPSPLAAAAAGAVGPGALAAAETGDAEGGLTPDDVAALDRMASRVGVDAIVRFLSRRRNGS
jgi:hypothetical protein